MPDVDGFRSFRTGNQPRTFPETEVAKQERTKPLKLHPRTRSRIFFVPVFPTASGNNDKRRRFYIPTGSTNHVTGEAVRASGPRRSLVYLRLWCGKFRNRSFAVSLELELAFRGADVIREKYKVLSVFPVVSSSRENRVSVTFERRDFFVTTD